LYCTSTREFPREVEIRVKVLDGYFGGTVAGSCLLPDKLTDHGYPDPGGTPPPPFICIRGQMVYFPGVNRPGLGVNHPPSSSSEVGTIAELDYRCSSASALYEYVTVQVLSYVTL